MATHALPTYLPTCHDIMECQPELISAPAYNQATIKKKTNLIQYVCVWTYVCYCACSYTLHNVARLSIAFGGFPSP